MSTVFLLWCLVAGDKPALFTTGGRFLTATLPRTLLDDPATRRGLLSGLTLSVELDTRLESDAPTREDKVLITVRYDVWEAAIDVAVAESGGQVSAKTFSDLDALFDWLAAYRIKLAALDGLPYPVRVRLTCHVIPYSAEEARETREWFAQRLQVARAADRGLVAGEGVAAPQGNGVFDVLMRGGIRERPLRTHRWKWRLTEEAPP